MNALEAVEPCDTFGLLRTVSVLNGKGGVYKTSIVTSLGGLLAAAGWRVLIVDWDPQGNVAEDLGLADTTDEGEQALAAVPTGLPLVPQPTGRERLDVIHGGEHLEDLVSIVQGRQGRDAEWMYCLAKSLASVEADYDLIIIDNPPGQPILQTLALVASRYVVIPTMFDAGSRKGMRKVAKLFVAARRYNPDLELLGVIRTGIADGATAIKNEVRMEIAEDLGGAAPVFDTCIRYAGSRAAKAVRDTGKLPHELESSVGRRVHLVLEGGADVPQQPRHAATSTSVVGQAVKGIAEDQALLAQEFLNLLTKAEDEAEDDYDENEEATV